MADLNKDKLKEAGKGAAKAAILTFVGILFGAASPAIQALVSPLLSLLGL
jgi:hypothetical protein